MKYINKIALIVMLLSGISTSAQIKRICIEDPHSVLSDIKIENNKIFFSNPTGIIYQNLTATGLPEKSDNDTFTWQPYLIEGIPISKFYFNGKKAIGLTPIYQGKRFIVRTTNGGKTYTVSNISQITDRIRFFLQNPEKKDRLIIVSGNGELYRSNDFGKTWEKYSHIRDCVNVKFHPTDSDILIASIESKFQTAYFNEIIISFDGGKNWKHIGSGFHGAEGITVHPANPDIIVISAGEKLIKSSDRGKTWISINDQSVFTTNKIEFDKRRSSRIYATKWDKMNHNIQNKLYYSDDFGATWNELCELELEEDDYISNFKQYNSKIYVSTIKHIFYEIDLNLL